MDRRSLRESFLMRSRSEKESPWPNVNCLKFAGLAIPMPCTSVAQWWEWNTMDQRSIMMPMEILNSQGWSCSLLLHANPLVPRSESWDRILIHVGLFVFSTLMSSTFVERKEKVVTKSAVSQSEIGLHREDEKKNWCRRHRKWNIACALRFRHHHFKL